MFPSWSRRRHPDEPPGTPDEPAAPAGAESNPSARRGLGLLALLELSDELGAQRDPFGIAGAALFNLMGHFGCSRGALWLFPENEGDAVPLRLQGVPEPLARQVGEKWSRWFRGQGAMTPEPIVLDRAAALDRPPPGVDAAREAELALIAPLTARGRVIGLFALGARVGGESFGLMEREVLRTSLNLLAMAIENATLRDRELEARRRLRIARERLRELGSEHPVREPGIRLSRGDLKSVLAGLLEERRPGIVADLRDLELSAAADVTPALFDPKCVTRIVDAMVDDAVRRTPCGARIRLRLEKVTDDTGDWVAVEVRDEGPGIPPEKVARLFAEPAEFASAAGDLDLGAAKRLAERMGGELAAETEVGKGSVLTLRVPAA